jgi:hypothetical protein
MNTMMKSPFPGMDPYLEARWSDVHTGLISLIRAALQPQLPAALRARAEERILLEEEPEAESSQSYRADVAVVDTGRFAAEQAASGVAVATVEPIVVEFYGGPDIDTFVHIIDTTNGNRVVTAIEILSRWNKGAGRLCQEYLKKLDDYERGQVSVVEIDLLRYPPRGRLQVTEDDIPPHRRTPYIACVRQAWAGHRWKAYPLPLRQPLPAIPIPLRRRDGEIGLQLQPLIDRIYVEGGHDDIDYSRPTDPPLAQEDAAWADELLRAAGRRGQ